MGREIYSKTMGTNLKVLFKRYGRCEHGPIYMLMLCCFSHLKEISKNPRIDVEKVLQIKYLHEFDR